MGTTGSSYRYPVRAPQGYACRLCGNWVRAGEFHSCSKTISSYRPADERLLTELRRIADALERLAEKWGVG